MKLHLCWLRCFIASAAGDVRGLAVVATAIAGLAYTGGLAVSTVLAIALTAAIVALLHGSARIRPPERSRDGPAPRANGPAAGDPGSPAEDARLAGARGPRLPRPPTPSPAARAMVHQGGADHSGAFGPSWQPSAPVAEGAPGGAIWLRRLGADLREVLENEAATRRLLARDVHRVPEEWLDEVMRVRMSDLESWKPRGRPGRWS